VGCKWTASDIHDCVLTEDSNTQRVSSMFGHGTFVHGLDPYIQVGAPTFEMTIFFSTLNIEPAEEKEPQSIKSIMELIRVIR